MLDKQSHPHDVDRLPEVAADQKGQTSTGLDLIRGLLALRDEAEAVAFLQDLCTPRELEDLTQRLQVARMLDSGASYARIQEDTGASATTVARVARCLKYGPGGYRTVLDRL